MYSTIIGWILLNNGWSSSKTFINCFLFYFVLLLITKLAIFEIELIRVLMLFYIIFFMLFIIYFLSWFESSILFFYESFLLRMLAVVILLLKLQQVLFKLKEYLDLRLNLDWLFLLLFDVHRDIGTEDDGLEKDIKLFDCWYLRLKGRVIGFYCVNGICWGKV